VKLCGFEAGLDKPLFLIAGPCVVESRQLQIDTAGRLEEICRPLGIPLIFKSSYDKANRSSGKSFRGLGMEAGLKILSEVKKPDRRPRADRRAYEEEVKPVAAVVDVLQTPAFLCRQTDFIHAAASAGRPVNIKKGQFLSPGEMKNVVDKQEKLPNKKIFSFASAASPSATAIWFPTCARSPSCATPAAPWCSMPRTRFSCPAGRALPRAVSANSSRCWHAPRWPAASPGCSWRRIPIRRRRSPTGRTPASRLMQGLLETLVEIDRMVEKNGFAEEKVKRT